MKKITLFLVLLISSIGFSQTTLLNFESSTTWTDFDGGALTTVTNPHNNADNNSANVGKMVKSAGQPWGGSWTELGSAIDFANNNTVTMKVYSPRIGAKVLFKVENAAEGAINFQKEVLTTVANAWETLTFNFSAINSSKSYSKVVIIFDNGTMGDGGADFTFYMDDAILSNVTDTGGPTVALPINFESATTWADFDGGVLTTEVNPHNNADNTSANVGKMVKSAGKVWGGSFIALSAAMDFASNDTFTMKVYSPRAGAKVLLKVENSGNGAINFQKEVLTTVANAWETLTFDYTTISKTDSFDKLVVIFDNEIMGDGSANFTFYIDDIALSGSTGGGDGGGTTSEGFCEKVITHLNIGEPQIASAIKLTVANFDANTLKVTIESNDSDPVDFILIPGDVTGSPTISAPDTSVAGKISLTLTWTATPPTDVLFNLLWSKVSTAGNWQLGEAPTSFKFAGTCETASVFKNELVNITMYPNPTSSKLNISAATTIKSIEIYNVLGKQVMNLNINNTSKSIDVSNLATGVYLIKYQVENTIGTSKFIKQ
ncbi:T9SS type A sorting domain-containing protein [uncultured Polaribacter sp.]|uniref:T9SS type A sorting domain-containing protein n=1 Tax=uncultured Polaribacter sp. TaxID=174711 RepID=UPI0030D906CE